ncbi:MAG: phosphoglycerate kinase [Alphaproteobacteria bacterium]|nr:phosphoglycerate kinase [Alphaproteobacteria bacterium]
MRFTTLKDMDLSGKRVLLRADLNVPKQDGKVTDTTRIDRLKPTIDFLKDAGAKILILSHFGRPDGEQNSSLSLAFLVNVLQERWGTDIKFAPDCIGPKAQSVADSLGEGEIALLENLRFHKGEKANDKDFIYALAALGDIYVNDAFSAAHRAHASTEGLAHAMPCAAGLLMEAELNALEQALGNPEKPVAAITGGSKISTKLSVLKNLVEKVDYLILGGGMANTFLLAQGAEIGNSLCEKDMLNEAKSIMAHAKEKGCEIILPVDLVTVTEISPGAEAQVVSSSAVPADRMAIDAGPETIAHIKTRIENCKTVVWNGPMGVFEIKPFDAGTNALAQLVAAATQAGTLKSIAGGGDTVAALENAGVADQFTYISTAGGAFLEWLEGKTLPGVAALSSRSVQPGKAVSSH